MTVKFFKQPLNKFYKPLVHSEFTDTGSDYRQTGSLLKIDEHVITTPYRPLSAAPILAKL
ncbi:hypothetical protein A9R01_07305 ['Osedax' symbiont bacterium Rs2_46_30_T18]|nr:hypothetical protein A9R01_07305 ['Osedax' symbiont bacterium Rs2_46_30_T18]